MSWYSLSLLHSVLAIASLVGASCEHPPAADPSSFSKITFDYLIIGGGTAGVALSTRLAETTTAVIGVIEAGDLHLGDQNIEVPYFSGVGNATFDWKFLSTPQSHLGNRQVSLPRGKLLGGSSGINGMAWSRGGTEEYDAWTSFARDKSWSWTGLLPFMKKSETFSTSPPNPYPGISPEQAADAKSQLPRIDGFTGPIITSYNAEYFDVVPEAVRALNNLGIPTNPQPQSGNTTGVSNSIMTVDRSAGVRSYAATTYFCSLGQHPKYHLLLNSQATRILLKRENSGNVSATGVEFVSAGKKFTASVRKEVILSAGAVQTPQLLELSGIGNSDILRNYSIQPVIDLPGVGENLQEHAFVSMEWLVKPGVETFDILRNNATVYQEQTDLYNKSRTGLLSDTDSMVALLRLQDIVSPDRVQELQQILAQDAPKSGLQRAQRPLAQKWFTHSGVPFVELIQWSKGFVNPAPGSSYVTMLGGIVQPTSRGSVHISSSDPLAYPAIDPGFLSTTFDTQVLLDVVRFMRKLGQTAPFSDSLAAQTAPDPAVQSDDELLAYIKGALSGGAHLAGSAPMAPRELGGVVDGNLKVYGTTNLRVADASVFPILISTHTQATVYAIAEKLAAEITEHA